MKRTILILFLLCAFNFINAQSYFTSSFGLLGQDHVGRKLYHINDTLNIIFGYSITQNGETKGSLYQLDSAYNLVATNIFNDSNLNGTFENIYPLSDTTFIITSNTSTDTIPSKTSLTIICFDNKIDTLWTITYSDTVYRMTGSVLHLENDTLYLMCNKFSLNTSMYGKPNLIAIDINTRQVLFNKEFSMFPNWQTRVGSYIYHEHRSSFFLSIYNMEDSISLLPRPYLVEINKLGNVLNFWQFNDTMENNAPGLIYNQKTKDLHIFYEDITTINLIPEGFVICALDSNLQIKYSNKYYNNWFSVSKVILNPITSELVFLAGGNTFILDTTGNMVSNNNYYSPSFPLLQINNQSATVINNDLYVVGITQYTLGSDQEMLISKCDFSGVGCYTNPVAFTTTPYAFQMMPSINTITIDSTTILLSQPHFNIQALVLNRFNQCIPNGIYENANNLEKGITVYPNPFYTLIQFENLPSSIKQIQVFSLEGKIIQTINHTISTDQSIDLSFLLNGIYLMQLNLADGSKTHLKIIKS